MLLLTATTDKFQLVTSAAASVDVHASFVDLASSTVTPGKQNTAITTAATTDIVAAPAASTVRNLKSLSVRNKHATQTVDVTMLFNQNGTSFELHRATLRPNELFAYDEGRGFYTVTLAVTPPPRTFSTADQVANAADTYIAGTAVTIPTGRPLAVGTVFIWKFSITKTAAGVATPIWTIRTGTNGSTADTARITLTGVAQTGVADTATVEIVATVRGPLTSSGIVVASLDLHHNLAATGFANVAHSVITGSSAAFDVTTVPLIVGVSVNPGSAGVWTFTQATGEVQNI